MTLFMLRRVRNCRHYYYYCYYYHKSCFNLQPHICVYSELYRYQLLM